jgi:hypothetical protein
MTLKQEQIAYYESQRLLALQALNDPATSAIDKPQFLYKIEFFALRIAQLSRE